MLVSQRCCNTEFIHQRHTGLSDSLVEHHRAIGIRDRAMEGSRGESEEYPHRYRVEQCGTERTRRDSPDRKCDLRWQQADCLPGGMKIKLPGAGFGVVGGAHGGPGCTTRSLAWMNPPSHRKTGRLSVPETLAGQTFKHRLTRRTRTEPS